MKKLSDKRIRLLGLLAESQRNGEFPLVREMAAQLHLAGRTSLTAMLASLEREGFIVRHGGGEERRQCIYRLTPKGEAVVPVPAQRLKLPVLGTIPAGSLSEAVQECDEFIDPGDSLRTQPGDFFLRVQGDSMIGDNILPEDRVLLRPGIEVSSGEIAGVQIKQGAGQYEATLKHVYFEPRKKLVRLRASNPAYEDIVVPGKDASIVGVYRGLIRRPQ